jgi:xanthine dehydrogenase YagS FAD-binding subunit
MKAFEWSAPRTLDEAVRQLGAGASIKDPDERPQLLAGGQDLLTSMKEGIVRPPTVVNLKGVPGLDKIEDLGPKGLRIGALVTIVDLAENKAVRAAYPGLAEAAKAIASPQIRNIGTVGGNLCQRPRCWYFRLEHVVCLKKGGDTCYSASGENKYNSIFGEGPSYIVHPSDLAPMLVALGGVATLYGAKGERTVPLDKFFTMPGQGDIRRENVLAADEILTRIEVPASAVAKRSAYLKFRERPSLDFAMSSVAAALDLGGDGKVREARLVLGAVAPIPWRVTKAEESLKGQAANDAAFAKAADLALEGAAPLSQNEYKIPLTKTLVRRALAQAAGTTPAGR